MQSRQAGCHMTGAVARFVPIPPQPPRGDQALTALPPSRPLQMAHDEGACYMPSAIYNTSIVLTHWGRLDRNHTSNSAYLQVGAWRGWGAGRGNEVLHGSALKRCTYRDRQEGPLPPCRRRCRAPAALLPRGSVSWLHGSRVYSCLVLQRWAFELGLPTGGWAMTNPADRGRCTGREMEVAWDRAV